MLIGIKNYRTVLRAEIGPLPVEERRGIVNLPKYFEQLLERHARRVILDLHGPGDVSGGAAREDATVAGSAPGNEAPMLLITGKSDTRNGRDRHEVIGDNTGHVTGRLASNEVPTGRRMKGAQTFMRREGRGPTVERRNPKAEGRKKAEARNPKAAARGEAQQVG